MTTGLYQLMARMGREKGKEGGRIKKWKVPPWHEHLPSFCWSSRHLKTRVVVPEERIDP
jgi:hypothetical protein